MRQRLIDAVYLAACCCALLPETHCSAAPWPRFRGPNGTGIAVDQGIPIRWTAADGVLWKVEIPGVGNSSPVVWGDHLFLQSATPDGRERLLLCLNVHDGKTLWTKSLPGQPARTHQKNTLASSTPATDGERVFALFWNGQGLALHAYNFQGTHLWEHGLGAFTSQHGPGASPLVYEDKVILANDQDGASTLVVLDAKTGRVVWEAPRQAFRACYSTPLLLEKPGEPAQLIVGSTAGITSYNPHNGSQYWNYTWSFTGMPLRTVASPIYGDGMIFQSAGDGSGERNAIAVKAEGSGDVTRTNLVWEQKRTLPYVPTMLIYDGHLYYVNDHGVAGCLNAKTGQTIWMERLGGNVSASPVLIDGKIYALSEDGNTFIFPASPQFKLLAKNSIGESVVATPAVADNRLYIRGRTHLFCIGKAADKNATGR